MNGVNINTTEGSINKSVSEYYHPLKGVALGGYLSHISAAVAAAHASDGDGAVLLDAVGDEAEEGADLVLGAVGAHGLLVDLGALGVGYGRGVAADPEAGVVASLGELQALGGLSSRGLGVGWVTYTAGVDATGLTVGDEVSVVMLAYLAREACNEAGSSDFCHVFRRKKY